uniref:Uncharacterized protein n=1 Tax=Marinobacter nauticus TaxID=2743 RepID=A0A455W1L7_MARNT|nr:hypothetical protein YBY_08670 [Marinobacter nauticus]
MLFMIVGSCTDFLHSLGAVFIQSVAVVSHDSTAKVTPCRRVPGFTPQVASCSGRSVMERGLWVMPCAGFL